tara:strand:- start:1570 stop:1992 length:423 start_codon:yes stop_codon:yes gene_type:complete
MSNIKFLKPKDMGKRDWGKETLLAFIENKYTLKKLFIKAGKKGGLQYHRRKNECAFILEGNLIIRYDNGKGKIIEKKLKKGDCFHIPPKAIHQEEAVTDCLLIEVSTPHFNDRVRVEKKYGLPEFDGLPTTKANEIKNKI